MHQIELQGQRCRAKEGAKEVAIVGDGVEFGGGPVFKDVEVGDRVASHPVVLRGTPEVLDGVELRRVRGEVLHVEPRSGLDELCDIARAVDVQAISDQDDLTSDLTQHILEVSDQFRRSDVLIRVERDVLANVVAPR